MKILSFFLFSLFTLYGSIWAEDNQDQEIQEDQQTPAGFLKGTSPIGFSSSSQNPYAMSFGFVAAPQVVMPEGFDPGWYLNNPEVPDALKSILSENESALQDYAIRARSTCVQIHTNDLLEFFNKEVMPLVQSKPSFCQAFVPKSETIAQQYWDPNSFNQQMNGMMNQPLQPSTVDIDYTTYSINTALVDKDEARPFEELLLSGLTAKSSVPQMSSKYFGSFNAPLSIPMAIENQPNISEATHPQLAMTLQASRESLSKPHPILIQTMLMRLWGKLSPLQQMQGLRECPSRLSLNNSSLTWEINEDTPQSNEDSFALFKDICSAQSTAELLPFMDESIMTEFALHVSDMPDPAAVILPLCVSWPEDQVVTPRPLPSATLDQIIYRGSEISRLSTNMYGRATALGLFNQRDSSNLTQEQITALSDYTANGNYDRINAYEMWGRLGVWYITDSDQQPGTFSEEAFNQYYPRPQRSSFQNQEQYEAAFGQYLQNRSQMLPLLYGTPEQREQYRQNMEQHPVSTNSMETLSGVPLSDTADHLKDALESLDGFEGVTFGGHQLSGHLFKNRSIREGATFSPGFFMSTSTTQDTALSFLGIYRGQFPDPRSQARIQAGEDIDLVENVTGYLFVVRNRNGVPIQNFSHFSSENEILLHPDAEYRIMKVEPLVHNGEEFPNAQVVYIDEIVD